MSSQKEILKELESLQREITGSKKKGTKKTNSKKHPRSSTQDESSTIKKLKVDKQMASLAFHGEEDAFQTSLADVAMKKAARDIIAELGYDATDSDLASEEEEDLDLPEVDLGGDTLSVEGMNRTDFKDAMEATELERKEVTVSVDLSKQIPKSSVTMGEFDDKLSFHHMAPMVIAETTLVYKRGSSTSPGTRSCSWK